MIRQHRIESLKVIHKDRYSYSDCKQTLYVADAEDVKILEKLDRNGRISYYLDRLPSTCPNCNKPIRADWLNQDFIEQSTTIVHPFPEWSFFFEATTCLSEGGYNRLRNAFGCWAKDKCGHAIAVMASLISPNVYDEVAELFKKPSPQGERSQ
jgi:hypothetical protein